jgi:hypothetical protein
MSGHVFVTCGNLKNLCCEGWLLPTDSTFYVNPEWKPLPEKPSRPLDWGSRGVRVAPGPPPADGTPRVWWTNTGASSGPSIEWFVEGATQFVREASSALAGSAPVTHRSKPLLALPLIGTGLGGGAREAGDILRRLLPALQRQAEDCRVDVVLVTRTLKVLSAAQAIRRRDIEPAAWAGLSGAHVEDAKRLAARAGQGELVLFIGAGVSASAGLPLWGELLDTLASEAGFSDQERTRLEKVNVLDRARILESRLGGTGGLGARVAAHLKPSRHSLSHTLLASLPVKEVATTNYDCLFERASEDTGVPCAVLPYQPSAAQNRWLLKLHGCVSYPNDIVLTREDYLRYAERRAALAGIVQALLVTRHMLFVGFGLQDDNFHRIAHDVRTALAGARRPQDSILGTALLLQDDPFLEELWRQDLRIVSFDGREDPAGPEAARRLEIFLDLLAMFACTGIEYVLDDDYADALCPQEREVKDVLRRVLPVMSPSAWSSAPGAKLARFLESMGAQLSGRHSK